MQRIRGSRSAEACLVCAVSVQCIDGASISQELEFVAGKVSQNGICSAAACNTGFGGSHIKEIPPDSKSSRALQKTLG